MLLSIALVSAGNIYRIDFTNKVNIQVVIAEKDVVRFNFGDKEHKIVIREVVEDGRMVKLTVFIEGAEVPFYNTLNPKYNLLLLDFDQNGVTDMEVKLIEVNGKKTTLLFKKVSEPPEITGGTAHDPLTTVKDNGYYSLAGLVFLLVMIFKRRFFLRNFRKIKRRL